MTEVTPQLAGVILLVWPVLTGLCTWKYLRALKQKKRLDTWIWFFAWCFCISAIEWWVVSVMILSGFYGSNR